MYKPNVVANSYFALGYGTDMTNTDMVAWIANGALSSQEDLYAVTTKKPT